MTEKHIDATTNSVRDGTMGRTPIWLQRAGAILVRWCEEPVGVAVPLFAFLVVFFAPQMPDMFAGMAVGNHDGVTDTALWHPLGLGLSSALLGFSAWYWTRAALLAPYKIDDAGRLHHQPLPASKLVAWSLEWAPRVALLAAALIAVAPLLMSVGRPERGLWGALGWSVLVGTSFVIGAFCLVS